MKDFLYATNRNTFINVICALLIAACTAYIGLSAIPEERAHAMQQQAWRHADADAESRAKAARARQIVQEAELLVLQRKNLDLARQINLSIR